MPLIAEEFWRATGLCLHELPEFTLWIKRGSYYHGLLVERDQLQEWPHLIGAPLPRWPQPKPSESCRDSYKRAEGPAVGSSEPSAWATTAPTQETPVEEPPVAEAPVSDTPHSSTPAPMEREMASLGLNRSRLAWRQSSDGPGPRNIPVPNLGNGRQGWSFPFPPRHGWEAHLHHEAL